MIRKIKVVLIVVIAFGSMVFITQYLLQELSGIIFAFALMSLFSSSGGLGTIILMSFLVWGISATITTTILRLILRSHLPSNKKALNIITIIFIISVLTIPIVQIQINKSKSEKAHKIIEAQNKACDEKLQKSMVVNSIQESHEQYDPYIKLNASVTVNLPINISPAFTELKNEEGKNIFSITWYNGPRENWEEKEKQKLEIGEGNINFAFSLNPKINQIGNWESKEKFKAENIKFFVSTDDCRAGFILSAYGPYETQNSYSPSDFFSPVDFEVNQTLNELKKLSTYEELKLISIGSYKIGAMDGLNKNEERYISFSGPPVINTKPKTVSPDIDWNNYTVFDNARVFLKIGERAVESERARLENNKLIIKIPKINFETGGKKANVYLYLDTYRVRTNTVFWFNT